MVFIYKITNKINGKVYIGQTCKSIQYRWQRHQYSSSGCIRLRDAIVECGVDNFLVEEVEVCQNNIEAFDRECYWIEFYNSMNVGYNMRIGSLILDETRSKISEANKTWVRSEETRAKMSEAKKGRTLSQEHKDKIGESGKKRTASEETRAKISIAKKGRVVSQETRDKLSKINTGNVISEETRAKISQANMGKHSRPHKAGRVYANRVPVVAIGDGFGLFFDSIACASRALGLTSSGVSIACKNGGQCGGYKFQYIKD